VIGKIIASGMPEDMGPDPIELGFRLLIGSAVKTP